MSYDLMVFEKSSFKATFTDMMITECKWETHK